MPRVGLRGISLASGASPSAAFSPAADLTGLLELWDYDDDASRTDSSGDVIAIAGQLGAYTLEDGAFNAPELITIGSRQFAQFNQANSETMGNASIDFDSPATQNYTIFGVARIETATNFDVLFAATGPGNAMATYTANASGDLVQNNGAIANTNTAVTLNSVQYFESYFSGSASDFLRVDGTTVNTGSAGNTNASAGFHVASRGGVATTFLGVSVGLVGIIEGAMQERDELLAWINDEFGLSL